MDTYTQLISRIRDRGATHASIAATVGVSRTAVQSWETRNSIPPEHWRALARCAEARGVPVSIDTLVHMAERAARERAA